MKNLKNIYFFFLLCSTLSADEKKEITKNVITQALVEELEKPHKEQLEKLLGIIDDCIPTVEEEGRDYCQLFINTIYKKLSISGPAIARFQAVLKDLEELAILHADNKEIRKKIECAKNFVICYIKRIEDKFYDIIPFSVVPTKKNKN